MVINSKIPEFKNSSIIVYIIRLMKRKMNEDDK